MEIINKKLSELKQYENNPRNNDAAVDGVVASIKEFGFKVPIIIDKDNVIVCGHTRYKAAKKLKFDTVPCIIADDLTEAQIKAFRLADNKVSEKATWNENLKFLELSEIEPLGIDMLQFGFEELEKQLNNTAVVEDEYNAEPPEEPKSKLGDIYQLGKHRVICGDCTDKATIEKLLNGNIADIAFTSPPYNADFTPSEIGSGKATKYNGNDDNKSEQEYIEFLNSYLRNALAFSKYVFMNVQSIANNKIALIDVLYENKDIYADTIIWDKQIGQPAMGKNVLNSVFEYIHIFSEKANRAIGTIEFRGTNDNILHLPPQRNNEYSDIHNATFSIEFASWFISRFAKESVFDSFGGTGTTLIACEQLNKICYMSELEPKYVDVIIDRWEKFTGQKAIKL